MFRVRRDPSSGSFIQCLAKITVKVLSCLTDTIKPLLYHCCSGKAVNITPPLCVFVAIGIQHAIRLRHIVTCALPRSTILFHKIS